MNAIELLKRLHRDIVATFDVLGAPNTAGDEAQDHEGTEQLSPASGSLTSPSAGGVVQAALRIRERNGTIDGDQSGRVASPAAREGIHVRQYEDDRQEAFDRLTDGLLLHAALEEQIFYPAVRSARTEDLVAEALQAHASLRRLLDGLRTLRATDPPYVDRLSLLREEFDDHIHDQEAELFPNVDADLGATRLEELGGQLAARVERMLAPRRPVATAVATPAPPASTGARGTTRGSSGGAGRLR